MISRRSRVSTFAIALLMVGLVTGVWLSAPICYGTDPVPPYNETAVEERLDNLEKMLVEMRGVIYEIKYGLFGARVIKTPITPESITNETDVIILPEPVTNETDVVIIVTDPLEELNLRIEFLSTNLHDLRMELSSLQSVDRAHKEEVEELNSKIAAMETTLDEQIEYLENKVSRLQNTIAYVCIGTGIIVILCAIILFKKGVLGVKR